MRILVAGVPRAGKTTLAARLGHEHRIPVLHTDDHRSLGWSESSAAVAAQMRQPGPWIIEGVAVPRAIRKWLIMNDGKPADVIYWLGRERLALSRGQTSMARGCGTVWSQILPELTERGVERISLR